MQFSTRSGLLLGFSLIFSTLGTPAFADLKSSGSFVFQENKKQYDTKIEAAAIKRAAEKIGELRGSVQGNKEAFFIDERSLDGGKTSRLGFPIIEEARPDALTITGSTGSVPII